MFTKRTLSLLLAVATLLAFGLVATGQTRAPRIAKLKTYLALTDAQVTEIRSLLKKQQEAAFPLRQQIRNTNQELRTALDTPEPNPQAIGQLVIARRDLRKQMRAINARLTKAIETSLTPEQKQKFDQLRERRARRGGRGAA